jgi:hypothetical protein
MLSVNTSYLYRRHDIQYNDIQNNDTQHNDIEDNSK